MPDMRPDAPRYLREQDAPPAGARATVDVTDLLARLAERTEELAEATVRQKDAEADLRRKTREMGAQRKAHIETCQRLETDCSELEPERDQLMTGYRELRVEIAREREAGAAVEADLERAQEWLASLQRELQIAWAQLQQRGAEAELRPWWSRLGS